MTPPKVRDIVVEGIVTASPEAILAKSSIQIGEPLRKSKVAETIRSIYSLGFFSHVAVRAEDLPDGGLRTIISVKEKPVVEEFIFEGKNNLTDKEIEKKIEISKITSLDEEELTLLADRLKELYVEKDYHHAAITPSVTHNDAGNLIVTFTIDEGKKGVVQRIFFKGNNCLSSKKLRQIVFTREAWIFSPIDRTGKYHPDALQYDKHLIESYYQNSGFLAARVTDIDVQEDPECADISVTFTINEGEPYFVKKVSADGDDRLCEGDILAHIPIRAGQLYSRERIRSSMETIRQLWGEYGYIYADVQPDIRPDPDTKTVEIHFAVDRGSKIHVNRISIVGNRKTHDSVIRRLIGFHETELLTARTMDESKTRVQGLGYFDQKDGVNWRIIKVNEELADLELMLKEVSTGRIWAQVSYGGSDDFQTPTQKGNLSAGIREANLWGTGIQALAEMSYSGNDKSINATLANPWLFDRPISASANVFHRNVTYSEMQNVVQAPVESTTGGAVTGGFIVPRLNYTQFMFDIGGDRIEYPVPAIAKFPLGYEAFQSNYQTVLNRRFQPGTLATLGFVLTQDLRNHPRFPSSGYRGQIATRIGIPRVFGGFGFAKVELDGSWYTQLINELDLVLHVQGRLGFIQPLNGGDVPYRELFNVGGPATVRGFIFGQISPQIVTTSNGVQHPDAIGGTKQFIVNVELLFPVTLDGSIRGIFFYDGGAGWDTPNADQISSEILRNNRFNYRHAIGFGIRLTSPAPVKIDWGFKLDRNKRRGEPLGEVHFAMMQDF